MANRTRNERLEIKLTEEEKALFKHLKKNNGNYASHSAAVYAQNIAFFRTGRRKFRCFSFEKIPEKFRYAHDFKNAIFVFDGQED